jgi:sarcosine oxidase subunit beta
VSDSAAVAVVGGGVIGASVAYHLAARGERDVAVLDRAPEAGAGSTGRATGGFRVQFASAVDVRLSLLAREKLRRFAEETGGDCGYVPAGYLWIAANEAELAALRDTLAVQCANGVSDAREMKPDEIAALNPALAREGIAGGTFCPSDGFIRPLQILDGYRRAAERLGVRFVWDADAVGFERARDGRVTAVRTSRGTFATAHVVNAAGAWAAAVARLAGFELPVTPLRRQVAVTVPTNALPAEMPMTIFAGDGFHLRVRDGRVLLLLPSAGAADPFDVTVEHTWIDEVVRVARSRVPALENVPVDAASCWAGLIRDVAGRTRDRRRRARRAELVSRQRFVGPRRDARARAGSARCRDRPRRRGALARRRRTPPGTVRRHGRRVAGARLVSVHPSFTKAR